MKNVPTGSMNLIPLKNDALWRKGESNFTHKNTSPVQHMDFNCKKEQNRRRSATESSLVLAASLKITFEW